MAKKEKLWGTKISDDTGKYYYTEVDISQDVQHNRPTSSQIGLYNKYPFHIHKLILSYEAYKNSDDIPPIGIPTDTYNLVETEINGQTVFILKEDGQFTATFLNNNIVYVITSNKLDYDECQKVVESMK